MREVTDTDWRSTAVDTAEMCDLKKTTVQCIFKAGVQTLDVYSAWLLFFLNRIETYENVFGVAAIVLNRIETYKNVNISTLLCDVKIDV